MRHRLIRILKGARQYPSLAAGLVIVTLFVAVSLYTVITIPYSEAVRLWQGAPGIWDEYPKYARPVWFDLFTSDKLPRTIMVALDDGTMTVKPIGNGMKRVEVVLPFRYDYDGFPSEIQLQTSWRFETSRPDMSVTWHKPDAEMITITEGLRVRVSHTYYISQDVALQAQLAQTVPHVGLFAVDPAATDKEPMHGSYQLVIQSEMPEEDDLLDASLRILGRVHGLAGTDARRRDLMLPLLWGAPVALAFGILAAVGAQVSTFILAGIGTWLGGKTEKAFQWITQVNIIMPILPILIMISHFYSPRIWTILGLVIALNVFSAAMITYRAMFLQLKEAPYLEAALAYGAGNWRIIFRYLLPRIAPTLLPQFVMIIPSFVFLEATLAILGLGDPYLPTWGKVLDNAQRAGALYLGHYYWIVLPSIALMLVGFGFALVGYSLDRIFNPRLRTV